MTKSKSHTHELSIWWRLYIYALHGYFSEIAFTAIWEFVVTSNFKLMGTTSLWTVPIYGVSGLFVERLFLYTKYNLKIPLVFRGIIYVAWTYLWEFSTVSGSRISCWVPIVMIRYYQEVGKPHTGYVLRLLHACPWDYEAYDWDFLGLICLEYAPFWYAGSMVVDQYVIPFTLQLQWKKTDKL